MKYAVKAELENGKVITQEIDELRDNTSILMIKNTIFNMHQQKVRCILEIKAIV